MKACVLHQFGNPSFGEFQDPVAEESETVVRLSAAAVNHFDMLKATGTFYLGPPALPSVVGSDGVGRTDSGRRVYFNGVRAPFGSLAESVPAQTATFVDVPDGLADETAAALGNGGLAAYLAITERAGMARGDTLLVLGATGFVGRLAVQIGGLLGAGSIVALGRNPASLQMLQDHGAVTVDLSRSDWHERLSEVLPAGFDVCIDLLWGPVANVAMTHAARRARYVQVGHLGGPSADIPAPALRSANVSLLGHANFHYPMEAQSGALHQVFQWAKDGVLDVPTTVYDLASSQQAWARAGAGTGGNKIVVSLL